MNIFQTHLIKIHSVSGEYCETCKSFSKNLYLHNKTIDHKRFIFLNLIYFFLLTFNKRKREFFYLEPHKLLENSVTEDQSNLNTQVTYDQSYLEDQVTFESVFDTQNLEEVEEDDEEEEEEDDEDEEEPEDEDEPEEEHEPQSNLPITQENLELFKFFCEVGL